MHLAEIIILIVGAVLFTVSFFMPDKGGSSSKLDKEEEKKQINRLLEDESEDAIQRINDAAEECVTDNRERMERAMERVSNEKIIAINEYSDTVLEEIKKNHDEVVFLYDMLNNKQSQIKNTAAEISMLTKSVKEVKEDIQEYTAATSNVENKGFGYVSEKSNRNDENKGFGYTVSNHDNKSDSKPDGKTDNKPEFESLPVTEIKVEETIAVNEPAVIEVPKKKAKKESANVKTPVADDNLDLMFASDNNSANNNDRILELHKAGKSNMAIAKELGLGIGEVKLVIDLFEGI